MYLFKLHPLCAILIGMSFFLLSKDVLAQNPDSANTKALKRLSIEQLMNIKVTSVSKRPEKLADVASAIQILTRQDIQRSTVTNLPEALRLLPNLQVTQLNSHHWIIGSRGFNSAFSNKLLVMIDGRTVYSPLFAGVFWDAQSVVLEDIERIEVISGPGGTLWGANAVNGVINIITRNAKDTKGLFLTAAVGQSLNKQFEGRFGGSIGSKFFYRVYGQYIDRDASLLPNGSDNVDPWSLKQGGFKLNWEPTTNNTISLQGNFYGGLEHHDPKLASMDGQNVMGKWKHTFSAKTDMALQAYFDRTWRLDVPSTINNQLATYDIDFQFHTLLGKRHNVLWGTGYRLMVNESWNATPFLGLLPKDRTMRLFNGFVQDEITLLPERLKLTLGTKLQHTVFTGFELLPSARVAYTPGNKQTIWAAASRALRSPSRIDVDYYLPTYPVPPQFPSVAGGPNFVSEKVIAYELGYRIQPTTNLGLSLATFYNRYDDLYSVEALPGTLTYQIQNGVEGKGYGLELSGTYQPFPIWQLRGGYTYFEKKLKNSPGNLNPPALLQDLGIDARNQAVLQSLLDLPLNLKLDLSYRYNGKLPATASTPEIKAYNYLDAHLSWQFKKHLELAISAQHLLKPQHMEYGDKQIQRNCYAKIIWRQ